MRSEKLLFAGKHESLTGWKIIQPIMDKWAGDNAINYYDIGSSSESVISNSIQKHIAQLI